MQLLNWPWSEVPCAMRKIAEFSSAARRKVSTGRGFVEGMVWIVTVLDPAGGHDRLHCLYMISWM